MGLSNQNKNSRRVLSEINVTPFVDVMLVLLIIFMITAPMMQQGIQVDLPETAASGFEVNEKPLVLVIKRNKDVLLGTSKVPLKNLRKKLKAIFETRKNKQIYIRADKKVEYGLVAKAMGEIRAAGIFSIGLITLPH